MKSFRNGSTLKFNPSNENTPKPPHETRTTDYSTKETKEMTKRMPKHASTIINSKPAEPPHKKGVTDYSSKAVSERLSKGMDNINHPTHYNKGGIETLDYIKAKTPHYESYAIGNIIKYVSRYQHKNGLEDLKKAQFYLNDLVEEMEKNV